MVTGTMWWKGTCAPTVPDSSGWMSGGRSLDSIAMHSLGYWDVFAPALYIAPCFNA